METKRKQRSVGLGHFGIRHFGLRHFGLRHFVLRHLVYGIFIFFSFILCHSSGILHFIPFCCILHVPPLKFFVIFQIGTALPHFSTAIGIRGKGFHGCSTHKSVTITQSNLCVGAKSHTRQKMTRRARRHTSRLTFTWCFCSRHSNYPVSRCANAPIYFPLPREYNKLAVGCWHWHLALGCWAVGTGKKSTAKSASRRLCCAVKSRGINSFLFNFLCQIINDSLCAIRQINKFLFTRLAFCGPTHLITVSQTYRSADFVPSTNILVNMFLDKLLYLCQNI
jgi:hypothetical protein